MAAVLFGKTKNLGFNQSQLLIVRAKGGGFLEKNYGAVRSALAQTPGVESVALSGKVPGETLGNNLIALERDETRATNMLLFQLDENYLSTLGVPLAAGRGLSETNPADLAGDNVLLNEACLPFFGWQKPEEALDQIFGGGWGKVVGVVRNFHVNAVQKRVEPTMFYFRPRSFEHVTLRLAAGAKPSVNPCRFGKKLALGRAGIARSTSFFRTLFFNGNTNPKRG